jgi:Transglycosylase SLT domain
MTFQNKSARFCCMLLVMTSGTPLLRAETRGIRSVVKSVVKADARTGRLVRTMVMPPALLARAVQPNPLELQSLVDAIAEKNQVEPPLVHSVIRAESNYNAAAISPKGAMGMMQLIPATQNIEGGVKYLKYLLDLYHQDYTKTIAAYNAGERAVTRYGGVPPYNETRTYVSRVAKNLKTAREAVVHRAPRATAVMAEQSAPAYEPIVASTGDDGKIYYRTP